MFGLSFGGKLLPFPLPLEFIENLSWHNLFFTSIFVQNFNCN